MTNEQKKFLRCLLALDQALLTNPVVLMVLSDVLLNGHAGLLDYLASSLVKDLGEDLSDFQHDINAKTLDAFLKDPKSVEKVSNHMDSADSIFRDLKTKTAKFDILKEIEDFLGEDNEDD